MISWPKWLRLLSSVPANERGPGDLLINCVMVTDESGGAGSEEANQLSCGANGAGLGEVAASWELIREENSLDAPSLFLKEKGLSSLLSELICEHLECFVH